MPDTPSRTVPKVRPSADPAAAPWPAPATRRLLVLPAPGTGRAPDDPGGTVGDLLPAGGCAGRPLLAALAGHPCPPLLSGEGREVLERLASRASRATGKPAPGRDELAGYRRIDLDVPGPGPGGRLIDLDAATAGPGGSWPDPDAVLAELRDLPGVLAAHRELPCTDPAGPAVRPQDDPLAVHQGYLGPAPGGIDARWAWSQGWTGRGIGFGDVEQGWDLGHEDLRDRRYQVLGRNRHGRDGFVGDHGTAVLGQVVAGDNRVGGIGIAPDAGPVVLSSHRGAGPVPCVAEAVLRAVEHLADGAVLLLEVQRGVGLPTETDPVDHAAVRLAVACGVVVVEAAGNGGVDLDTWQPAPGLRRPARGADDSGAVLVAAASATVPHTRWAGSCHGERVDCFAWGDSVVTAGYGDGVGEGDYTFRFSGTSSAAAIVAGAALLLQSALLRVTGAPGAPRRVREVLADRCTGTPPAGPDAIGVQPDLQRAVPSALRGAAVRG